MGQNLIRIVDLGVPPFQETSRWPRQDIFPNPEAISQASSVGDGVSAGWSQIFGKQSQTAQRYLPVNAQL